jgi:tRNA-splicing ligase RtcB
MTTVTANLPFVRLSPVLVEIPMSAREDMRVSARVYADGELWPKVTMDHSLDQVVNVSTLPGVTGYVYAMPDVHEGYGFPVGGVAAFKASEGIVSPGGVGYDINCGVRLLASELRASACHDKIESLVHDLSRSIPSGMGRGGALPLSDTELDRVLGEGCSLLVDRGLAGDDDLPTIEANGSFSAADPSAVSVRAKNRGRNQLGTLGSGNHFVEVQVVEEVFDELAAAIMDTAMSRYGIQLPDRELACTPFTSTEGKAYFGAMCAAANFAFCNRQVITHTARRVFERVLGSQGQLRIVYDVAHNMAKLEEHEQELVVVHRKGATRAFGPGHPETPEPYRRVGQPVFIPGSMGTASYVLAGTEKAMRASFGSACHGAGRAMSRRAAKRIKPGSQVRKDLEARGIVVRCPRTPELAEEAPHAYKDVDAVVDVVHRAGLARKVARLIPLGVVKA